MKARKAQLFEADERPPEAPSGPNRPFREYLRDTPAAPLPTWAKASLWAAGLIVAALLVLALARMNRPRPPAASPEADRGRPAEASATT